jgi:uroporphyrinogen-III synthase
LLPRTQERPSRIASALRGAGAQVIEAADSEAAAQHLRERVPDALLFPSSGCVAAVAPYLARLRSQASRPVVAAMGEASAAAAREAGFIPDVVAPEQSVAAFVHSITECVLSVKARP